VSTVATPGEWQCKIRTGGVRQIAVANGPNIFQMLLVTVIDGIKSINGHKTQIKITTINIKLSLF